MSRLNAYKGMELYLLSKKLAVACYAVTHELPPEEHTNFARYIRTACLNVHISVAQGAFRKSKKRKKFFTTAANSLIIIDAACDILVEVGFATPEMTQEIKHLTSALYQLLETC